MNGPPLRVTTLVSGFPRTCSGHDLDKRRRRWAVPPVMKHTYVHLIVITELNRQTFCRSPCLSRSQEQSVGCLDTLILLRPLSSMRYIHVSHCFEFSSKHLWFSGVNNAQTSRAERPRTWHCSSAPYQTCVLDIRFSDAVTNRNMTESACVVVNRRGTCSGVLEMNIEASA